MPRPRDPIFNPFQLLQMFFIFLSYSKFVEANIGNVTTDTSTTTTTTTTTATTSTTTNQVSTASPESTSATLTMSPLSSPGSTSFFDEYKTGIIGGAIFIGFCASAALVFGLIPYLCHRHFQLWNPNGEFQPGLVRNDSQSLNDGNNPPLPPIPNETSALTAPSSTRPPPPPPQEDIPASTAVINGIQ